MAAFGVVAGDAVEYFAPLPIRQHRGIDEASRGFLVLRVPCPEQFLVAGDAALQPVDQTGGDIRGDRDRFVGIRRDGNHRLGRRFRCQDADANGDAMGGGVGVRTVQIDCRVPVAVKAVHGRLLRLRGRLRTCVGVPALRRARSKQVCDSLDVAVALNGGYQLIEPVTVEYGGVDQFPRGGVPPFPLPAKVRTVGLDTPGEQLGQPARRPFIEEYGPPTRGAHRDRARIGIIVRLIDANPNGHRVGSPWVRPVLPANIPATPRRASYPSSPSLALRPNSDEFLTAVPPLR